MDTNHDSFKEQLYVLLVHLRTSQLLVQNLMSHPLAQFQDRKPGEIGTPHQQIGFRVREVFQKADWFVGKSLQLLGDDALKAKVEAADEQIATIVNLLEHIAKNPEALTGQVDMLTNPNFNKDVFRSAFMEGVKEGSLVRSSFERWYVRTIPQSKSTINEPVR